MADFSSARQDTTEKFNHVYGLEGNKKMAHAHAGGRLG